MTKPVLWVRVVLGVGVVRVFCDRGLGGPFIIRISSFIFLNHLSEEHSVGGILKQRVSPESPEQIVRFYSGIWNNAQLNYSTIKKEILSIVLCTSKFQSDLLNKKFLL